ncbi:MAG TPA: FAD-dependent oxidoreductase [Longimicrobiaceae bacterium]|nr:FAD-dependent oxidoreductase [Longimicrobiaceae bacterium]
MSTSWDAVVVGAGPAGSATATRLARAGHRVLLLDREEFPRDKPCGECVNPAAVRALESLGTLDALRTLAHADLGGWRIRPAGAPPFEGRFPPGESGMGIRRVDLDAVLLDLARRGGAAVRTGARVTDVVREDGRVTGVRVGAEEIRARLVVGADGLRSIIVRRLGLLRRGPKLRKLALTAHVRGVWELDGLGELHVFPWGCVGVAAVGGGQSNVTVVVTGRAMERVTGARDEYFDGLLRSTPRFRGAERVGAVQATGPFDWPTRGTAADGALVVGDAAGYFDPFTGQGIYRALRGAELAAAVADAALRSGDLSAARLAPYHRAQHGEFGPGQRVQRLIEGFVARPALLRAAGALFRRRPALSDALIAVTGDLAPVRSLLTPGHGR